MTRRQTIPTGHYGIVTLAPGHCATTRILRVYRAGQTLIARGARETGHILPAGEIQWQRGDFYGQPDAGL